MGTRILKIDAVLLGELVVDLEWKRNEELWTALEAASPADYWELKDEDGNPLRMELELSEEVYERAKKALRELDRPN